MTPKVAIYTQGGPNYLIDVVVDGFLRVLGSANVFIDGYKPAEFDPRFIHLYPLVTGHHNLIAAKDCDLVICDNRVPNFPDTSKLLVMVDGDDYPNPEALHLNACSLYFMREYLINRQYHPKCRPLPFAAIPRTHKTFVRDVDVFCNMTAGYGPMREAVLDIRGPNYHIGSARIDYNTYQDFLHRAVLAISARGCGEDTFRTWEIPFCGAVLVTERTQLTVENNFTPDEAIFWSSAGELADALVENLKHPKRLEQMQKAGTAKSRNHHLSVHRALKILTECGLNVK